MALLVHQHCKTINSLTRNASTGVLLFLDHPPSPTGEATGTTVSTRQTSEATRGNSRTKYGWMDVNVMGGVQF